MLSMGWGGEATGAHGRRLGEGDSSIPNEEGASRILF